MLQSPRHYVYKYIYIIYLILNNIVYSLSQPHLTSPTRHLQVVTSGYKWLYVVKTDIICWFHVAKWFYVAKRFCVAKWFCVDKWFYVAK